MKNYTLYISDIWVGDFNTPTEIKNNINFRGRFAKFTLSDVKITSRDGDEVRLSKLHYHYNINY